MCKISDKLQLCTCAATSVDKLKHYWVLYKLVKGKNHFIVGETMPPFLIEDITNLQNKSLLLQLLNDGNVFDEPIHPAQGDLLELSFQCNKTAYGRLYYGFKYMRGKWREEEYDSLSWSWHHDEAAVGEIKNAIQK
jgi:hypothetical protein